MTDLDRQVAERAARVIGIELAKQRAVTEAQLRLQGDLLDDLLSGSYPSEEAMLARARWMGHDLSRPHTVLALSLAAQHSESGAESHASRRPTWCDRGVADRAGCPPARATGHAGHRAPRTTVPTTADALELGDRLRERLSSLLGDTRVTIGLGRHHPASPGWLGLSGGRPALAIGRALLGGGRCVHFEHLGSSGCSFSFETIPNSPRFMTTCSGGSRRTTSVRAPSW